MTTNKIIKPKVTILMATYNGEEFVKEQIESIIVQSYDNWDLLIRDDQSTDDTLNILTEYEKKEARIKIIRDENGNVGQCTNFDLLMQRCLNVEGYYMFADQDDVWNSNKVELSLRKIMEVEKTTNQGIPILIYTNYLISDSELSQTKLAYKKPFYYSKKELASRLLVQNWMMGCTMIINNPLLELSVNIPIEAENHDNWIAILSSLVGRVDFLNETTMKHRIHSNNVTTQIKTASFSARLVRLFSRFRTNNKTFEKRTLLLTHIKNRIIDYSDQDGLETLGNYSNLLKTRGFEAVNIAYKYKFNGVNKIQTTLLFMQLMVKNTKPKSF